MSEQRSEESGSPSSAEQDAAERDPLGGADGDEGIELTMGEPNSFEPEEDPEASAGTEED